MLCKPCFRLHSIIISLRNIYFFLLFQYGPVVQIDLKVPPRPPGYAFVEVSLPPLILAVTCVMILDVITVWLSVVMIREFELVLTFLPICVSLICLV